MHYLPTTASILQNATLAMTNIAPSNAVDTQSVVRAGSGLIALTGDYTGAADSLYELEVLNATTGSAAQVSAPVFVGVGSGTITDVTVDGGTAAQTITITLVDAGTQTVRARVPIGSGFLEAIETGSDGNGITVSIDHSGLVSTATEYSVREELPAGTFELVGDEYDWGHAPLQPDGTLSPDAPRLRFRDHPTVYRAYRFFRDNRTVFALTPPTRRPVRAGTPVLLVSGTRSATVAQGATSEPYTGIRSLYDLLAAIDGTSALLRFDGVLANDLLPGGMGADDLDVFTSSYCDGVQRAGTRYAEQAELVPVIAAAAPTERIVIECRDTVTPGRERWSVVGSVSGVLGTLTTGELYSDGPITSLTVPQQSPPATQPAGTITGVFQMQGAGACGVLHAPVLGVNAVNRTMTWKYVRRVEECDCESIPVVGGPNAECLGVEIGGDAMGGTAQVLRIQLDRWSAQVSKQLRRLVVSAGDSNTAVHGMFVNARNALSDAITACFASTPTKWVASSPYDLDEVRAPLVENGFLYRASVAGSSGASQPAWPTTIGETIVDSGVTWECISKSPRALWLEVFASAQNELQYLGAMRSRVHTTTGVANYAVGERVTPSMQNGHWYSCEVGGNQGMSEPTWPTDGSTIADGDALFRDMGNYWTAAVVIQANTVLDTYGRGVFITENGGTTGSTEPEWNSETVTDGTVTWVRWLSGARSLTDEATAEAYAADFNVAFRDSLAELYAVANVNFEGAGDSGTNCWQPPSGEYQWVCTSGGAYLPATPNRYYHSVVRITDAAGNSTIQETKEFGFQISTCDAVEGDTVEITIVVEGSEGLLSYQTTDRFELSLTRAVPLSTANGADGDDTHTWRVVGSVDGALADLAQDITAASTDYSDGGIDFTLTPGAIPHVPGDRFIFSVEGGQFRWRRDGGSWSSANQIEPAVVLDSGLSAAFTFGPSPAFVTGDAWSFNARAINGPAQLRQPLPTRCRWLTGGAVLTITPADPSELARVLFIADHTIPSGSTITLQGSDDNFATTPTNIAVTWRARHICHVLDTATAHAKWRIALTNAGSALWVFLGDPERLQMRAGPSQGAATWSHRLPTRGGVRRGKSINIRHGKITPASIAQFLDWLSASTEHDDGRFGVLPHLSEPSEVELVRYDPDAEVEITEEGDYTDPESSYRRHSVALPLQAVA